MKKIFKSLATIVAVVAVVAGATYALFDDVEVAKVRGTAGTIDIDIDGANPYNGTGFDIGDMKPGETGEISFTVNNVGKNAANVSKRLYAFTPTDSGENYACSQVDSNWTHNASSEPECVAENGTRIDDVQTQFFYGLAVEVYATQEAGDPIWWQTIYDLDGKKKMTEIYDGTAYVELGMIPAGGKMIVKQAYEFDANAGNQYQGDGFVYDMEILASQMSDKNGYTKTALENKAGDPDWAIIEDAVKGELSYKTKGEKFEFSFNGTVNTAGSYDLIYVGSTNNYPCEGSVLLGTATADGSKGVSISGKVDTASITNGKIWLVPDGSYDGSVMISWPLADILFETDLINYQKN